MAEKLYPSVNEADLREFIIPAVEQLPEQQLVEIGAVLSEGGFKSFLDGTLLTQECVGEND